jgi:hypothetical protein
MGRPVLGSVPEQDSWALKKADPVDADEGPDAVRWISTHV